MGQLRDRVGATSGAEAQVGEQVQGEGVQLCLQGPVSVVLHHSDHGRVHATGVHSARLHPSGPDRLYCGEVQGTR